MPDIKIDVVFISEQSKLASEALENMMYCIQELKNTYTDVLGEMKSDEFIKEFDESIEELLNETDKISEESIEGIIKALADLATIFEDADISMSEI